MSRSQESTMGGLKSQGLKKRDNRGGGEGQHFFSIISQGKGTIPPRKIGAWRRKKKGRLSKETFLASDPMRRGKQRPKKGKGTANTRTKSLFRGKRLAPGERAASRKKVPRGGEPGQRKRRSTEQSGEASEGGSYHTPHPKPWREQK